MPGRGTPWRFGKGVKDRVGSADIKDDTITSADIKDLTITEADLDSSVTTKLNKTGGHTIQDEGTPLTPRGNLNFVGAGVVASDGIEDTTTVTVAGGGGYDTIQEEGVGVAQETTIDFQGAGVTATAGTGKTIVTIPGGAGGGGGGSNDLEQAIVFEEDFFSNGLQAIHSPMFGQLGSGQTEGNNLFPIQVGGVFDMIHDNDIVGTLWGIEHGGATSDFANFDFTGSDCIGKFGIGFNALTNMSAWVGFMDTFIADNQATPSIANIETPLAEGAFFRWHSTTSGNWFAVTMTGGTKTETDTGVAVTAGNIIRLKITYTDATSVTFTINEVDVATHTTNLPATDLGWLVGGATLTQPNTNGGLGNPHGIDYIQIEQARSGATIGVGADGVGGGLFPNTVPFTRYVLYEEFNNNDTTNLEVQYGEIGGNGQIGITQTKQTGGVIVIGTGGVAGLSQGLGTVSNITKEGQWTDPTKNAESKIRTAVTSPLTNRLDFVGFMDNTPLTTGATSVALAEGNFANGAYFRYDGTGNWQAVTMLTNTKTTTDTGVAPDGSQQNFEIIFTSTNIVFKINGVIVATHTTNLPIVLIFLQNNVIDQSAVTHDQELDTWYVIADR